MDGIHNLQISRLENPLKLVSAMHSASLIPLFSRWQTAPHAAFCWARRPWLYGAADGGSQVFRPDPLQPAGALYIRRARAPLAPWFPVQQRTPGLPPPPPVHEQEDGECKVKVAGLLASFVSFLLSVNAGQHTDLQRFLTLKVI